MIHQTVSVAMATYNGAKYLQEQLDSFLTQSRLPDELIVTDDCSSDQTLEILRAFQVRAPFSVYILRNDRKLGYSRNFEKALLLCSKQLIFISDQDDVWFPAKIERVCAGFTESSISVIVHNHIMTGSDLSHNGVTKLDNIYGTGLSEDYLISGCCTAMRREWLQLSMPIPHDRADYDAWINRLAALLVVRRVIEEPLQYVRRHGNNASSSIVNQPKRVSMLDLVWRYGLGEARPGWRKEIEARSAYIERLLGLGDHLRVLELAEAADEAIARLQGEITAFERRIDLIAIPRWRRFPALLKLLNDGTYGAFAGWKSAAKDLIR